MHGHITSLAVLRSHRKMGLAAKLMTAAQEAMSWLAAAMDDPSSTTSVPLDQQLGQTRERNQDWSSPSRGDASQSYQRPATMRTPSSQGTSRDAPRSRSAGCRANADGLQTEIALQAVPGDELRMLGADEEAELLARVADVLNATPPPPPPSAPPVTSPRSAMGLTTPTQDWKFFGIPLSKPRTPGS